MFEAWHKGTYSPRARTIFEFDDNLLFPGGTTEVPSESRK
jgi:hypothetical protein